MTKRCGMWWRTQPAPEACQGVIDKTVPEHQQDLGLDQDLPVLVFMVSGQRVLAGTLDSQARLFYNAKNIRLCQDKKCEV